MKRRNFVTTSLTGLLGTQVLKVQASEKPKKKRSVRFVHLTDMHIYPNDVPEKGMKLLLDEIHALDDQPDFVINTGDNIMDSLKRSKEETEKQWKAWHDYYRTPLKYPLYSCIGNHDVWGWGLKDQTVKNDPLYGKAWAVKELGIPKRYYSVEMGNWLFIFLDSPMFDEGAHSYTAKLDDEQFTWLSNELKRTAKEKSICIVSHIPILSASVFFDGENESSGDWKIPGAWMHVDVRRIKDLFVNYPNIKLAISGHVHLADYTAYLGVNYLCNGAACGAWWKGNYQEFPPMYAIIDLFEDGSYQSELVYYKWQ